MAEEEICYHCKFFGPYSQNRDLADYWCFRHDMRVTDKTPGCSNFARRKGGEMSVNAPYLGLIERECDRRSEEREMQEYRKTEQRRNLVYSGFLV